MQKKRKEKKEKKKNEEEMKEKKEEMKIFIYSRKVEEKWGMELIEVKWTEND